MDLLVEEHQTSYGRGVIRILFITSRTPGTLRTASSMAQRSSGSRTQPWRVTTNLQELTFGRASSRVFASLPREPRTSWTRRASLATVAPGSKLLFAAVFGKEFGKEGEPAVA